MTGFETIQQQVQVIEDRSRWDQRLSEERERLRAAGLDDGLAYAPNRARPESGENDYRRDRPASSPPVPWDEQAAGRFGRVVILGDPGMGKSWLLRIEARRLAIDAKRGIVEHTKPLGEISVPIRRSLVRSESGRTVHPPRLSSTRSGYAAPDSCRIWLRAQIAAGRAVVLLDAWDEVPVERPEPGQPIMLRLHYQQAGWGSESTSLAGIFPDAGS